LLTIRGIKAFARLMQWLIPLIALLWVAGSVFICLWHIEQMPGVIASIVKSAFGWQEAAAGAAGYTLTQAITSGLQRGMFSNEAAMGPTPNAAAAATPYPPHPPAHGLLPMPRVLSDPLPLSTPRAILLLPAAHHASPPPTHRTPPPPPPLP
ncbi:sodium:alanine symporter family protein, partial [Leptospira interrogans serovar Pomona]|nr:sodium:alanine symporter family protein [Leptospira interrogans serovar Pomona]